MSSAINLPTRSPVVPERRLDLSESKAAEQIQRGAFVTERGVPYAIPVDDVREIGRAKRLQFQGKTLWRQDAEGRVMRPGVRLTAPSWSVPQTVRRLGNKYISKDFSYMVNLATLGHDLHESTYGNLFARQFHVGWTNPFDPELLDLPLDLQFVTLRATHFPEAHAAELLQEIIGLQTLQTLRETNGENLDRYEGHRLHKAQKELQHYRGKTHADCRLGDACPAIGTTWDQLLPQLQSQRGFIEDLGHLSASKVTDAFVSEEIDELVSATASEYADFDSHEVGTSSQAENNNDTALITTSGIARAAGTPTDADPIYQSVGTITADATETWEEHGLFNNTSGAALMDRSTTGGQAVNSSDQVEYTYSLTKNPEA